MTFISRLFIALIIVSTLTSCTTEVVSGKVQKAPDYKRASEINVQLGLNALQRGEMARAKEKFLLALKQDPDSTTASGAMGYYLERTGNMKQAESYYKKAIDLADVKAGAENNYGTFLCRQKRYNQADYYFQQAAVDENYVHPDKAYVNAGVCALLVPDRAKAQQYFQQALEKNPNSPQALLELAKLQFGAAEYAGAKQHLERYMKITQADAPTLWLAIRTAQRVNDIASVKRYGGELRSRFPNSKQYQQYQQLSASLA